MASFDFITDEQLRESLESDYTELVSTIDAKAWKAAHVLAGSIVEAVLVDYLVATDYYGKQKAQIPKARDRDIQPLEMTLGQLIEACKAEGILSDRSANLSAVVQGYRNLIHPGRVKRLAERIDEDGATVAKSLVEMIVRDISIKRQKTYGFTAVQIVKKVVQDPDSVAIIDHLLRDMNPSELERLLTRELPDTYLNNLAFVQTTGSDPTSVNALKRSFRPAFERASDELKTKVVKRFVTILKEESQDAVVAYEEAFFQASDLNHLSLSEVSLVKQHLVSRIMNGTIPPNTLMQMVEGLGHYMEAEEAFRVGYHLVWQLASHYQEINPFSCHVTILDLHNDMTPSVQSTFARAVSSVFELQLKRAESPQQRTWLRQARPPLANPQAKDSDEAEAISADDIPY